VSLGFSTNGELNTYLIFDIATSYLVNIYVKVLDNMKSQTLYDLSDSVTLQSDQKVKYKLLNDLNLASNSPLTQNLYSGDTQRTLNSVSQYFKLIDQLVTSVIFF
jgi:hypothetical protein